ncbi:MAG: HAD family hydrolase [Muribaculaceae bacterium]
MAIDIKNLLFDLGGVIMDIDKNCCIRAFEALGMRDAGRFFGDFSQQGPFRDIEQGAITVEQFHTLVGRELRAGVSDAQIDAAFNAFLLGIPVARLRALEHLNHKYNICLLSNTNPIMWGSAIRDYFAIDGHAREDYFAGGIVTSFEAKCLKPDRRIFDHTAATLGIAPEQTLFFDDSATNVAAAIAAGYNAVVVPPGTEFTDVLQRWLSQA